MASHFMQWKVDQVVHTTWELDFYHTLKKRDSIYCIQFYPLHEGSFVIPRRLGVWENKPLGKMKKCEVLLDIPSIRGKVQMQKKKIEGKEEAKVEFPKDRVEVQMKKKSLEGRKESVKQGRVMVQVEKKL